MKHPRVISISLDILNIDDAYQRTLNRSLVEKIVEHFDPAGVGLIAVSRRSDGTYWVIDGQHRVEALRLLGIPTVMCIVEETEDQATEASVFMLRNTRKEVLAFDKFRARLTAKDPDAVAIDATCRSYGFPLARCGGAAFSCVATVERIWRGIRAAERGPATLKATLGLMRSAWGATTPRPSGDITLALAIFLDRYGKDVDTSRLAVKLSGFPGGWTGILGKARGLRELNGGSVAHGAVEAIWRLYNTNMKSKALPPFRKEALAA